MSKNVIFIETTKANSFFIDRYISNLSFEIYPPSDKDIILSKLSNGKVCKLVSA